jgi:hypothetical protein
MFYTEEDIQPVVEHAITVFGAVGNMLPTPYVFVSVQTNRFGAVWYGDVQGDYTTVVTLANVFANKINDTVTVTDLGLDTEIVRL